MGGEIGLDSRLNPERGLALAAGGRCHGQTRGGVRGRSVRYASDGVALRRPRRLRALPRDVDAGGRGLPEELGHAPRSALGNPRRALLSGRNLDRLARLFVYRRDRDLALVETREAITPSRGRAFHSRIELGDFASSSVLLCEPGGLARFVDRDIDAPGHWDPARLVGKSIEWRRAFW